LLNKYIEFAKLQVFIEYSKKVLELDVAMYTVGSSSAILSLSAFRALAWKLSGPAHFLMFTLCICFTFFSVEV